jgi:hypothetical protein
VPAVYDSRAAVETVVLRRTGLHGPKGFAPLTMIAAGQSVKLR